MRASFFHKPYYMPLQEEQKYDEAKKAREAGKDF
jgi:hypothetical protein